MFNKKIAKVVSILVSILMITSSLVFSNVIVSAAGTNVLNQNIATNTDGWSQSQGEWYFFTKGTKVTKTWRQDTSKKWFYLGSDGAMVINIWEQDSSKKWFYLGSDGAMVTNIWEQDSSKKWYYLGSNGAMVMSVWKQDSSKKWYYLGSNGAMLTSTWITWNAKQYYVNINGDMAENTIIDGWVVGADGAWNGKPQLAKVFNLGETAIVHDTLWGTYELTINSVELTAERNQFDESNPKEVYKISYTYKLLAKGTDTDFGLFINGFDSVIDSLGLTGQNYPDSVINNPQVLNIVGTSCNAETYVGVSNVTTNLTLTMNYFKEVGQNYVTFVIPTK